jgi:hypothetical protein
VEPTLISETSAFKLQTPGKFPKEHRLHSKHGESLKTTIRVLAYFKVLFLLCPGTEKDHERLSQHQSQEPKTHFSDVKQKFPPPQKKKNTHTQGLYIWGGGLRTWGIILNGSDAKRLGGGGEYL